MPMTGMEHGNNEILMAFVGGGRKQIKVNTLNLQKNIRLWRFLYNPSRERYANIWVRTGYCGSHSMVPWSVGDPAVKNVLLGSKYRCRYVSSISELVKYWRRVSWSLCHGNCGSFLVLEKAKTFFEECSIYEKYIFKRKDITLLSQEKWIRVYLMVMEVLYIICWKSRTRIFRIFSCK